MKHNMLFISYWHNDDDRKMQISPSPPLDTFRTKFTYFKFVDT